MKLFGPTRFGMPLPVSGWFNAFVLLWPETIPHGPAIFTSVDKPARDHGLLERERRRVDHGDGVPQRVRDVEMASIVAERQVARVGAIQVVRARRNLRRSV